MKTLLLLIAFAGFTVAQEPTPKDWAAWAKWAEKLHPITDAEGHGPDIGSDEWANALGKRLGVIVDGGGPAIDSEEFRAAVEKKLLRQEKRELLSSHDTVAKFEGIKEHTCPGRTSLCPDRCGHSGKLATFEIVKYLNYEKLGEFGDPRQEQFQVLIGGNIGNVKMSAEIHKAILALKPGDKIHLKWNHDYVTRDGSSSPQRTVTLLKKLKNE